uniref:Uncharacterized protein n=2 Tax=Chenopodium quinoa TaxID=63459 RepID=A0A803LNF6_CHEQI
MIFDRLKHESDQESVSLVCKRFLSITNSLKVSIKIPECTTISTISRLVQRFPNLKQIQFSGFREDLNEAVVAIARSGLDLEELLDMAYDRYQRAVWLEELGSNMKNLKVLRFAGGEGDADLVRVADSFPQLEELHIRDRYKNDNGKIIVATDKGMDYMSLKLKRLRKIVLSDRLYGISDKSLISLSKNCPLLEQIEVTVSGSVTAKGISFLVNNSHHLNSLYLSAHFKIESFGVKGSTDLTNLQSLMLTNVEISDDFLVSIIEARIPIACLFLADCEGYTFSGISRLLQHLSQSLKSLALVSVEFLTNEHIEYLSSFLENLTSIQLRSCSNLSESAFVMITQRCLRLYHFAMTNSSVGREEYIYDGLMKKNRAIKYLDLSLHKNFSPAALKRLLNICPEVEKLDLSHCFLPRDQLNVPFIFECNLYSGISCNRSPAELDLTVSNSVEDYEIDMELELSVLEELIVSYSGINDKLLTKISPRLTHLDLEGCKNVTEKGVKEVVKSCKRLRYLNISYCDKLDFKIIAWILTNRSSLRKLVSTTSYDHRYQDDDNLKLFLQQGCLTNRSSLRKLVSTTSYDHRYQDDDNLKLFLQQGCLVLKGIDYSKLDDLFSTMYVV